MQDNICSLSQEAICLRHKNTCFPVTREGTSSFFLCHKMTFILASYKDMSSYDTRRPVFLWCKNSVLVTQDACFVTQEQTHLLVTQEDAFLWHTHKSVSLLNENNDLSLALPGSPPPPLPRSYKVILPCIGCCGPPPLPCKVSCADPLNNSCKAADNCCAQAAEVRVAFGSIVWHLFLSTTNKHMRAVTFHISLANTSHLSAATAS